MENLTIEQQIRSEIYRAFELIGADRELLAVIGSCATGFLWRTWLFLYILPWGLAAACRLGN